MTAFTVEELMAACDCSIMTAANWHHPMLEAVERWEIVTPKRKAAFCAQVAHESARLSRPEEIWGPTAAQRRYDPPGLLSEQLGNFNPGDGYKYRGRGPIQITGCYNYRRAMQGVAQRVAGVRDWVLNPELVSVPRWGCHAAGWYWLSRGLNELADEGNFEQITRKINGALTGYEDRLKLYQRAKQVFNVKG